MKLLHQIAALALLSTSLLFAKDKDSLSMLEKAGGVLTYEEGKLTKINFKDASQLSEEHYQIIGEQTDLKSLTLIKTQRLLNGKTYLSLLNLKNLESIVSEGADLSDDEIAKFSSFQKLRNAIFIHLSTNRKDFTGEGFSTWKDLPNLKSFTIAGVFIGDPVLKAISQIKSLKNFSTWHTWQTHEDMALIAKMKLTDLHIGQKLPQKGVPPSLTSESLKLFAQMDTLENLSIMEVRLKMDDLLVLKKLKKLKSLKLRVCDIPDLDLETLQSEFEGVKIDFTPLTEEDVKLLDMYIEGPMRPKNTP